MQLRSMKRARDIREQLVNLMERVEIELVSDSDNHGAPLWAVFELHLDWMWHLLGVLASVGWECIFCDFPHLWKFVHFFS